MPTINRGLQRKRQRAWYARNKAKQLAWVTDRKQRHKEAFRAYKETLVCVRCGEDESCCLDFHHRDPGNKEATISQAVASTWGKDRLAREIAKCDVVCRNCHAKIHAGVD